jgi:hypothetical protein
MSRISKWSKYEVVLPDKVEIIEPQDVRHLVRMATKDLFNNDEKFRDDFSIIDGGFKGQAAHHRLAVAAKHWGRENKMPALAGTSDEEVMRLLNLVRKNDLGKDYSVKALRAELEAAAEAAEQADPQTAEG